MLTEEQLAALIDSLSNVERLVLVGDPRQLPPIGAGRPFVDIVRELEPDNVETFALHCGPGYAELTIPRRQQGEARADVLLASHFSGRPLDPGADAVMDERGEGLDERLRLVQWDHPQELQEKLVAELVEALRLAGPDDELGFEESLGGARYGEIPWAFFWSRFGDNPGAAARAEAWQMLSPVRAGLVGVDALNRMLQTRACGDGGLGPQSAQSRRPADAPLRGQGHQRHQPAEVRRLAGARWAGLYRQRRHRCGRRAVQDEEVQGLAAEA